MRKLTRPEAIKILKQYIKTKLARLKWFKQIKPYLKAIVFYGSTAKGLNRPDSDIDILLFVPLHIETKYTKGEYFYKFNGREINIVLRSMERLRRLGKKQNDLYEAEVFRKCGILYESDSEVRTLIKKVRAVRINCK